MQFEHAESCAIEWRRGGERELERVVARERVADHHGRGQALDAARTGERDVAAAQATANAAALTRNHAAVEVAAAYRAEVDAEIAKAPGSPVDAIRAADRVRAKILRRRGGR